MKVVLKATFLKLLQITEIWLEELWASLGLVALTLSLPLIGVISFKETLYDLHEQIQFGKNKVQFIQSVREDVKESQAYLSQEDHLIPQLIEANEISCQKLSK